MKHAEPWSLPSSRGYSRDVSASASAAAALGWAKQKPLETKAMSQNHYSPSAARAASLAADARSPSPRGQPRSAGAFPRTLRSGSPRPGLGNSAAAQAYKAHSPRLAPQTISKNSPSLLAAQEAVGAARPRSISSPVLRQSVSDQASGDANDSRDDTATQRWEFSPGSGSASAGDGPVLATTLPPSMFTANPPVDLEVEEKKKADELHASAVAMAKNMFKQQPKLTESFLHDDDLESTIEITGFHQHPNLHEAAYKLAQKRLAKIHGENQKNREFQGHYAPSGVPRRRFTIAGRLRRRTSSDNDVEFRHKDRVSNRTSRLSQPEPADAGDKMDRSKVLEAARRNVRSQLDGIDQSVADRTGMVPPSAKSAWESRARAVAQAKAAAAAVEEPQEGQRDVGGGLYVAQDDIEALAKQNLKPLFQEIDERAEKERERERRLQEENDAKEVEAEKKETYNKEVRDIHWKLKAEQKEKEKERQRVLKEEERARKRGEKAGRRVGRGTTVVAPEIDTGSDPIPPNEAAGQETPPQGGAQQSGGPRRTSGNADDGGSREQGFSPGKVKNWLRAKLMRQKPAARGRDDSGLGKGFVGGHVLRSPEVATGDTTPASSAREVALARRIYYPNPEEAWTQTPSQGDNEEGPQPLLERRVSSGTDEPFEDVMESISPPRTPPRIVTAGKNGSPVRDSRFVEMMD